MMKYLLLAVALILNAACQTVNNKPESNSDQEKRNTIVVQDTNKISLKRKFIGKEIQFLFDSKLEDGYKAIIWEQKKDIDKKFSYQVNQLGNRVLLYNSIPEEVISHFYGISQPTLLEFIDSSQQTIKLVNIWENLPFSKLKLTYFHLNAESNIINTNLGSQQNQPTEYTLTTHVSQIGNHVVVIYKRWTLVNNEVVDLISITRIYDLKGKLVEEIDQIPLFDQAIVSPNGKYLMYLFGGSLRTTSQPFGSLDDRGVGIWDILQNEIIFSELEKEDAILDGLYLIQGMLHANSTTPFDDLHYDYNIFFDQDTKIVYKKHWLQTDWNIALEESKNTGNSDWKYFIEKFDFEKIEL